MPLDERSRLTFHAWLVDHDLDAEVANAILGVMPPFDWHEIPKKDDIYLRFDDVDRRFDQVDRRFEQVDRRFEHVDQRFDQVDRRFDVLERSIDARFTAFEGRLDRTLTENLRWTLVTMVLVLTGFAGLILGLG